MRKAIAISTLLVGACMLVSCSSARRTDAFGEFFHRESLRVQKFYARTNDIGYEVAVELVGATDTNRIVVGCVMFEDVGKRDTQSQRLDAESKERERKEREGIQTNTNLRLSVMCGYGRLGWITDSRLLDSDRIKNRFPDFRIFSVGCLGDTGNPVFTAQPLVIGTNCSDVAMSTVFVLGNPPTVASFISEHRRSVRTGHEARDTLELFCELQSWTICEKMPDDFAERSDAKNSEWVSRWKYRETETKDGWTFQTVFLTDPMIRNYSYYEIEVLRDGTITLKNRVYMGSAGGYI